MSTLSAYKQLTLTELAQREHNGNALEIAEILDMHNPILSDIPFREANDLLGEKIAIRKSIPQGQTRKLNSGIEPGASQTETIIDTVGLLEQRSETDVELVEGAVDPRGYRATEDRAFIEGMGQSAADLVFYGNAKVDPEGFNGLATRMGTISPSDGVYDAGGTGNSLTSIYVAKWAPQYVYGLTPRGSRTGLDFQDLGIETVTDAQGKKFRAYVSWFRWKLGLAVRDPRAIKRIANIDTAASGNPFAVFEDLLIKAVNGLVAGSAGAVIYVNSDVQNMMDIAAKDKTNINYTFRELGGQNITLFKGVPVRQVDAILSTEAQVS